MVNRAEYKRTLKADRLRNAGRLTLIGRLTSNEPSYILKYQKLLRRDQWLSSLESKLFLPFRILNRRKLNRLGIKLGFLMNGAEFGEGLVIWHAGSIIINPHSRIGDNCTFHGDNCLGNSVEGGSAPELGNGVNVGFGAKLIGDIRIADNVTIGAGAIVTRSCDIEGAVLAGVPARVIKVK